MGGFLGAYTCILHQRIPYMPARCYPVTEIQLMGAWNMHNWWKFRLLMRFYSSVSLFSDGIPSPDGTLACMFLRFEGSLTPFSGFLRFLRLPGLASHPVLQTFHFFFTLLFLKKDFLISLKFHDFSLTFH